MVILDRFLSREFLPFDRKDTPFAGNPLKRWFRDRRNADLNRYKVLDRARHQYLAGASERRDARADVNGNTAYVLIDHFAFASMEPCPDLDPKGPDLVSNGAGAATPRAGPSKVARMPSPVVLISWPRKRARLLRTTA